MHIATKCMQSFQQCRWQPGRHKIYARTHVTLIAWGTEESAPGLRGVWAANYKVPWTKWKWNLFAFIKNLKWNESPSQLEWKFELESVLNTHVPDSRETAAVWQTSNIWFGWPTTGRDRGLQKYNSHSNY